MIIGCHSFSLILSPSLPLSLSLSLSLSLCFSLNPSPKSIDVQLAALLEPDTKRRGYQDADIDRLRECNGRSLYASLSPNNLFSIDLSASSNYIGARRVCV